MRQLEQWRDQGHHHLLESDIESCFDSIDRDLLLSALSRYVPDARLMELLQGWMETGTLWLQQPATAEAASGAAPPLLSTCGIPQGSVLSPLLCNLFLDAFDEALLRRRFKLVRYADDFVIVATRRERAEAALDEARLALAELGLRLHPAKTRLVTFDSGFHYLGSFFMGDLMLPAPPHALSGTNACSGYPHAPFLPQSERSPAPAPPSACGQTAVASVLAQARVTKSNQPAPALRNAFEQALVTQKRQTRQSIHHEASTSWEMSYLV